MKRAMGVESHKEATYSDKSQTIKPWRKAALQSNCRGVGLRYSPGIPCVDARSEPIKLHENRNTNKQGPRGPSHLGLFSGWWSENPRDMLTVRGAGRAV